MTCSLSFEDRPVVGSSKRKTSRRADHIEADVEPFALAAAERLFHRAADDAVAPLVQAELDELAFDAAGAVAPGKMRRADGRGELRFSPMVR